MDWYILRPQQLRQCKRCLYVNYCSEDCADNDYTSHQIECAAFEQLMKGKVTDTMRLVIRACIWVRDYSARTKFISRTDKFTRKYSDMMPR